RIPDEAPRFSAEATEVSLSCPVSSMSSGLSCGQCPLQPPPPRDPDCPDPCSRSRTLRRSSRPRAWSVSYHRHWSPPVRCPAVQPASPRNENRRFLNHSLPPRRMISGHCPPRGQQGNIFHSVQWLRSSSLH